jgi:hypothetical protein
VVTDEKMKGDKGCDTDFSDRSLCFLLWVYINGSYKIKTKLMTCLFCILLSIPPLLLSTSPQSSVCNRKPQRGLDKVMGKGWEAPRGPE